MLNGDAPPHVLTFASFFICQLGPSLYDDTLFFENTQGKEDEILNYEVAIMTVEALKDLGRKAELTIYDNGTHALVNSDVVAKVESFVRTRAPGKVNVLKSIVKDATTKIETISESLNSSINSLSVFLGKL